MNLTNQSSIMSLINPVTDGTSFWDTVELILSDADSEDRSIVLNELMAGVALCRIYRKEAETAPEDSAGRRTCIRKVISNLNELYPFNVHLVQDKVLATLRAKDNLEFLLSNDIGASIDFMTFLSGRENDKSGQSQATILGTEVTYSHYDTLLLTDPK